MKTSLLVGILMLALLPRGPQNPLALGSVEGIVRNAETREPIADVEVSLAEDFDATVLGMRTVRTDINGRFILTNVAPNKYTLVRRRFIAVIVGGVEVRGQVVVLGQVARPLIGNPYLTLATEDISTQHGKLDGAGVFTIPEVINGVWRVQSASPQNNLVVVDVRQGSESVYESGFAVNDRPDLIQIVLSPVGSIDGVVRDGKQQIVAGAHVVIVPAVGGVRRTTSDAAGRFAFPKVAVGEYRVYAMRASEFPNDASLPTPSALRTFLGRYAPQSRIATALSDETVSVVTPLVEP